MRTTEEVRRDVERDAAAKGHRVEWHREVEESCQFGRCSKCGALVAVHRLTPGNFEECPVCGAVVFPPPTRWTVVGLHPNYGSSDYERSFIAKGVKAPTAKEACGRVVAGFISDRIKQDGDDLGDIGCERGDYTILAVFEGNPKLEAPTGGRNGISTVEQVEGDEMRPGDKVALRTTEDETDVGIFLKEMPLGCFTVPTFWAPNLKRVVRGCECWWRLIEAEYTPVTADEVSAAVEPFWDRDKVMSEIEARGELEGDPPGA